MDFENLQQVVDAVFSGSTFIDVPTYSDLRETIYHYTTPAGLLGILDEEALKLRFTRYDCVNDTSEGYDVLESYIEACKQLNNSREIDDEFYRIIKEIGLKKEYVFSTESVMEDNSHKITLFMSEFQAYICCFSKNRDSLPMWNYYSKDGHYQGYSIGLSRIMFLDNKGNLWNKDGVKCQIGNVIYENEQKIESIKYWIRNLYKFKDADNPEFEKVKTAIYELLLKWHLFFKSDCFAHENEVRAVLYIPKEFPTQKLEFPPISIEHTIKGAYITPYITVSFNNGREYLHELIIGPLSEKKISYSTIESLLKERKYNAKIINSDIPIRF